MQMLLLGVSSGAERIGVSGTSSAFGIARSVRRPGGGAVAAHPDTATAEAAASAAVAAHPDTATAEAAASASAAVAAHLAA